MKIGITGATGFIGSHLIDELLKRGHGIRALVIEQKPKIRKEVEIIHGDLIKNKSIDKFLKDVDVVIHLAAIIDSSDELMFAGNTQATHNLVQEALKHSSISKIIFTSSVAVYGKNKKNNKFSETEVCYPNTSYGLSKYQAEKEIIYWSTLTNKRSVILRPFNIYGPGNGKGLIYSFYKEAKTKRKLIIYGDGSQERDFLFVEDLIEVFIKALSKNVSGIYNLGNIKKYSVHQISKIVRKIMGNDIEIKYSPYQEGKVFNINQSLTKVKKELGWQASTAVEVGLRKAIAWYDKHSS